MTLPGLKEAVKEMKKLEAPKRGGVETVEKKQAFKLLSNKITMDWWTQEGKKSFVDYFRRRFFEYVEVK